MDSDNNTEARTFSDVRRLISSNETSQRMEGLGTIYVVHEARLRQIVRGDGITDEVLGEGWKRLTQRFTNGPILPPESRFQLRQYLNVVMKSAKRSVLANEKHNDTLVIRSTDWASELCEGDSSAEPIIVMRDEIEWLLIKVVRKTQDRELVREKYLEGRRDDDIAERHGMTPAQVRMRVTRAIKAMQAFLDEPGGDSKPVIANPS